MVLPAGSSASPSVDCVDLELSGVPAPQLGSEPGSEAYALVRLHGHPVGVLRIDAAARAVDGGASVALDAFRAAVTAHLALDGVGIDGLALPVPCHADAPASSAFATVVVCTLGEDPRLRRTIDSVLAQTHGDLEVVVVDNNPSTGAARALLADVDDPRLRIVAEPCRGLSAARNAGVANAAGSVIAFTDDDASADPAWLRHLCAAFGGSPDVVAVTGLVVPDELGTPAQRLFEEFGGFDKGFARTLWTTRDTRIDGLASVRGTGGVLFPYAAGVYGSGNNMAFRAEWLRTSSLFDEALGAGSLTRGGEDLDAFLTVMLAGKALVYEPAALVRHSARREMTDLASQLRGYGSGNSAALTKHALAGPGRALGIAARVPAGLRRLVDPSSEKNAHRSGDYPKDLARAELRGFAAGPFLYLRSRREARRRRRLHPLTPQRPA